MLRVNPAVRKQKLPITSTAAAVATCGVLLLMNSFSVLADVMIVNADHSLEWNQKEAYYHATGNAQALQGNREIRAESLKAFYDPQTDAQTITRIVADGDVSFSDEPHKGGGRMLDYDTVSLTYLLTGPGAVITGPDGTGRADQTIMFKRLAQRVELIDNAEIQLVDGRYLSGQEIIIYLDDAENISRITADGNVTLIQADGRTATASKADYNRAADSAILTGNVVVKNGETELAGGRAEVDFATGISKMLADKSGQRVSGRFTRLKE